MDKRKKNKKQDLNATAFSIVQEATGEGPPRDTTEESPHKNPHAVALGRLGGKKGGKERAKKLTAKERSDIARIAANARWKKKTA